MHPAAQVVNGDATCVVDCERMSGYDVTNLVNGDDVFDLKDDLLVKQQFHSVLETDVIFSRIRGIENRYRHRYLQSTGSAQREEEAVLGVM